MDNLAIMISQELRRRGCKTIKSVFLNEDTNDLSVFLKDVREGEPQSFNYPLKDDYTIEGIATDIAEGAAILKGEPTETV